MGDPRTSLGHWDVVAGDPLTITLNIKNPDGTATNLTTIGTAWSADLRQTPPGTAVAFTVDATNAATGTLVLSLTAAQTATLTNGPGNSSQWTFDLQATGGAVTPQTLFTGTVTGWRAYTHA